MFTLFYAGENLSIGKNENPVRDFTDKKYAENAE